MAVQALALLPVKLNALGDLDPQSSVVRFLSNIRFAAGQYLNLHLRIRPEGNLWKQLPERRCLTCKFYFYYQAWAQEYPTPPSDLLTKSVSALLMSARSARARAQAQEACCIDEAELALAQSNGSHCATASSVKHRIKTVSAPQFPAESLVSLVAFKAESACELQLCALSPWHSPAAQLLIYRVSTFADLEISMSGASTLMICKATSFSCLALQPIGRRVSHLYTILD